MRRRRRSHIPVPIQPRVGATTQAEVWAIRALLVKNHLLDFVRLCVDPAWIQDLLGRELDEIVKLTPAARSRFLTRRLKVVTASGVVRDLDAYANAETLGDAIGLTQAEKEVLAFAVVLEDDSDMSACVKPLLEKEGKSYPGLLAALAATIDVESGELRKALSPDHRLASCGLLRRADRTSGVSDWSFEVPDHIRSVLRSANDGSGDLLARLLVVAPSSTLTWEDFPHIESEARLVREYLTRALATRRKGVNLLFHGPAGVGKTELGRLAARTATAHVFEVASKNDQQQALDRDDRLTSYLLCQALASSGPAAVVLFDEIEDVFLDAIFEALGRASKNKAWTNRLLEENPVPTIWISNRIDHMDPAFLRRFDLIVEVQKPPRDVRRRILADRLRAIPHEASWLSRLVQDDRATPADLDRAARVAAALGQTEPRAAQASVEKILDMNLRARFGRPPAGYRHDPTRYDLGLVNTSIDLNSLVATLKARLRGTVCLHGASGTGKTAFVHQVGVELGLPVVLRRGSDLLDMYVGGTEQNIAAMFREARDEGGILLLDEADSFLRDRRQARHSWEVTQVNELLVQMEAFEGIFFCSTNLIDDFDVAAFRRFALKVRFDPLRPEQRRVMLGRLVARLGVETPDGEEMSRLLRLDGLTPGDFAAVEGRFEVLGQRPPAADIVEALADELTVRGTGRGRSVGFSPR